MLLVTVPLMIILAVTAFLFNSFTNKSDKQKYSSSGNFLLYHTAMYGAASSVFTNVTIPYALNVTSGSNPYTLSYTPSYFQNITFNPMGDYNSYILRYNNVKYIVSSFSTIMGNNNDNYAAKTLKSIAEELQTPTSGTSQNYQVKIALINTACTANILNVGLTGNVVNSATYGPIFTSLCNSAPANSIKKYVLMEQLP
jgi:hypothetical protein